MYTWDSYIKMNGLGLGQRDQYLPDCFRFWKKELSPQHPGYREVALWIDMRDAMEDGIDFVEDDEMGQILSEGQKHGDKVGDRRTGMIDRKYIWHAVNLTTKENLTDSDWYKSLEADNSETCQRKKWTKKRNKK